MANQVHNIALGQVVAYYRRVDENDPATAELYVIAWAAADTDNAIKDADTVAAIEALASTAEATNSGYARKVLTDADLVAFAPDDTNDRVDLDIPDQTWTAVAAGGSHVVARKADGSLLAWGWNRSGQLGDGSLADTQRPGLQVRADRDVCGAVGHDEGRLAVEPGHGGVGVVGDPARGRFGVVGDALGAGGGRHADGTDVAGVVGHTDHERLVAAPQPGLRTHAEPDAQPHVGAGPQRPGPTNGHWAAADWIFCRDGKWRPVMPGTFPLVDGAPQRVGRLRGYGNAIVAQVAETFIASYLDVERGLTL